LIDFPYGQETLAEDATEWGAFGFMFVFGVLSFGEAKPRNSSTVHYLEKDEFKPADFVERLRFVRGELHFDADYIRGRRVIIPRGTRQAPAKY
jgi:hypothetical protein